MIGVVIIVNNDLHRLFAVAAHVGLGLSGGAGYQGSRTGLLADCLRIGLAGAEDLHIASGTDDIGSFDLHLRIVARVRFRIQAAQNHNACGESLIGFRFGAGICISFQSHIPTLCLQNSAVDGQRIFNCRVGISGINLCAHECYRTLCAAGDSTGGQHIRAVTCQRFDGNTTCLNAQVFSASPLVQVHLRQCIVGPNVYTADREGTAADQGNSLSIQRLCQHRDRTSHIQDGILRRALQMGVAVACARTVAAYGGLSLVCAYVSRADTKGGLGRVGVSLHGINRFYQQRCQLRIGTFLSARHSFKPCVCLGFGVHNTDACQIEAGCACGLARYRVGASLGANRHRAQLALDTVSSAAHLEGGSGPGIVLRFQQMGAGAHQRRISDAVLEVGGSAWVIGFCAGIVSADYIHRFTISQEIGNVHISFLGGFAALTGQFRRQFHSGDLHTGQTEGGLFVVSLGMGSAVGQQIHRAGGGNQAVTLHEGGRIGFGSCLRLIIGTAEYISADIVIGHFGLGANCIIGVDVDGARPDGAVGINTGLEIALGFRLHQNDARADEARSAAILQNRGGKAGGFGFNRQRGHTAVIRVDVGIAHLSNGCGIGDSLGLIDLHAAAGEAAACRHLCLRGRIGGSIRLIQNGGNCDLIGVQVGVPRLGSLNRVDAGIEDVDRGFHKVNRIVLPGFRRRVSLALNRDRNGRGLYVSLGVRFPVGASVRSGVGGHIGVRAVGVRTAGADLEAALRGSRVGAGSVLGLHRHAVRGDILPGRGLDSGMEGAGGVGVHHVNRQGQHAQSGAFTAVGKGDGLAFRLHIHRVCRRHGRADNIGVGLGVGLGIGGVHLHASDAGTDTAAAADDRFRMVRVFSRARVPLVQVGIDVHIVCVQLHAGNEGILLRRQNRRKHVCRDRGAADIRVRAVHVGNRLGLAIRFNGDIAAYMDLTAAGNAGIGHRAGSGVGQIQLRITGGNTILGHQNAGFGVVGVVGGDIQFAHLHHVVITGVQLGFKEAVGSGVHLHHASAGKTAGQSRVSIAGICHGVAFGQNGQIACVFFRSAMH